MHNLEKLAGAIAEAIEERREGTIGCFSVRPKHVNGHKSVIYKTAVTYILNVLAHTGLAVRQELSRGVKYVICKDSELYVLPKEEMARRIMEEVVKAEEKA